jgi:hypothetical protein
MPCTLLQGEQQGTTRGAPKPCSGPFPAIDLGQWSHAAYADHLDMKRPREPPKVEEGPSPERSRLEEAQRIVEEYVNDLREIIKKLRKHPL